MQDNPKDDRLLFLESSYVAPGAWYLYDPTQGQVRLNQETLDRYLALSSALVSWYGRVIRNLRSITNSTVNKEPKWRRRGHELTTGYRPSTYGRN